MKATHETGGYGSVGYGCTFKREEATKNLLRTHTTAISAQMLYQLANQVGLTTYSMLLLSFYWISLYLYSGDLHPEEVLLH